MQLRNVSKRRGRLVGLAVAVLAAGVLVVVAPGSQAVATAAVPVVPAVARNADGRLELFAVDADCHIRYRWQLTAGSTSWSPWKVFGGCVSSIAAATNGLGGIEVFGSENAGKVFHRWQLAPNADSWSTWVDFAPAGTLSAPASLTMASGPPGPGPLVVLGADSAGHMIGSTEYRATGGADDGGTYSGFGAIDGSEGSIAAEIDTDGRVELFGVQPNGTMAHRWELVAGTGQWSSWVSFNPPAAMASVSVSRTSGGALVVFGTTTAGQLVGRQQSTLPAGGNEGNWSGWISEGTSLPAIVTETNADGRLQLIGADSSGAYYEKHETSQGTGNLTSWTPLDPSTDTTGPVTLETQSHGSALGRNADGRMTMFAVGLTSSHVVFRTQLVAGVDAWSAWHELRSAQVFQSIAAVSATDGRIELFGNVNGRLAHTYQLNPNQDNWSPWVNISSRFLSASLSSISATVGPGGLVVHAIDSAGHPFFMVEYVGPTATFDGRYSGEADLSTPAGGPLTGIASQYNALGKVEVFAVQAATTKMWHTWEIHTGVHDFVPWVEFGGTFAGGSVSATMTGGSSIEVYGVDLNHGNAALYRRAQFQAPDGSDGQGRWSDWANISDILTGTVEQAAAGVNADGRVELAGIDYRQASFVRHQILPFGQEFSPWVWVPFPADVVPPTRPDGFPSTVPSGVKQWDGLSSADDGVGFLHNTANNRYLYHTSKVLGVDLEFRDFGSNWAVRGQSFNPQLVKGQAVALRPAGAPGWLKTGDGDPFVGVPLEFNATPSYEWYVLGDTLGEPLGNGTFALWNSTKKDFLIFSSGTGVGVVELFFCRDNHDLPAGTCNGGGGGGDDGGLPPKSGVKQLRVFNCAPGAVNVWIKDGSGSFANQGSVASQFDDVGCVAKGSTPLNFTPADGHSYQLRVTNPTQCDDPANNNCVVDSSTFVGNQNGNGAIQTDTVGRGTALSP
jgi:hypothetical protein